MYVGSFFIPSESNELTNNLQIFYYLPYREENGIYPFYLAFTEDKIKFYFAGNVEYNGKAEYVPATKIFKLHLYNDKFAKKELEDVLAGVYDEVFPKQSNYILLSKPKRRFNGYKIPDTDENNEQKILLSRLVLDFLYDIKHSEVFNEANHFGKIRYLLKESEFVQAILAKVEFYFQFDSHRLLSNNSTKIEIQQSKSALKNWIALLQEHDIHKTVKPKKDNKPYWFKDVETELSWALNSEKNTRRGNSFKRIIRILEAKIKKKKKSKKDYQFEENELASIKNRLELFKKNNLLEDVKKESDNIRGITTSLFIERNNILKAWLFNGSFEQGVFWSTLFLIVSGIFIFILKVYFGNESLKFLANSSIYIPLFGFPLITIGFGLFFVSCKDGSAIKWGSLPKKILKLITYLMLPLWALIFGATHVVFNTQSFYNKIFIKNHWTAEIGIFLLALLLLIISFKVTYRWSSKKIPRILLRVIISLLRIIFPLLILFFVLKFIPSFDSLITFSVLISVLFGVLYFHEKESHPNLDESTSVNKTFSMLFYGLVISFFINVFYINTEYKEYLETYEYLGHIWHHTQKEYAFNDDEDGKFILNDSLMDGEYYGVYKIDSKSIKDTLKLYSISNSELDLSYFYVYEPYEATYTKKKDSLIKSVDKFIDSRGDSLKMLNSIFNLKVDSIKILQQKPDSLKQKYESSLNKLKKDTTYLSAKIVALRRISNDRVRDSLVNKNLKKLDNDFYKKYKKVKQSIYQPLSDDIEVTIDKVFFEELNNVYLYKQKDDGSYKRSKVPVLKKVNIFGIQITTIPNILFINTFLSLFIAVILQIFIHKTKFLKGGSGHGH